MPVCINQTQTLVHPRGYDLESASVSVIHRPCHRVPHSWGGHILHFSSSFCSYQATWWHEGRGKKEATARTCVGRSKRCMKIKARRQSKSTVHDCAHIISPKPEPERLPVSPGLFIDDVVSRVRTDDWGDLGNPLQQSCDFFSSLLTTGQRNDSW